MAIYSRVRAAAGTLAAAAVLTFASASGAATPFDGHVLNGVHIDGEYYDVTFHSGSFNSNFPTGNLTFTTAAQALAADDAIVALRSFQTLKASSSDPFGGVVTAYDYDATQFYAAIEGGNATRGAGYGGGRTIDYGASGYTFATYALSANTVFDGAIFENVMIGDRAFDVTLHDGTFDGVFPDQALTFFTGADALVAADAIVALQAFQDLRATQGVFGGLIVSYGFDDTNFFGAIEGGNALRGLYGGDRQFYYSGSTYTYATFAERAGGAVPEPAAWAMLILGLGGAGAMLRLQRRPSLIAV